MRIYLAGPISGKGYDETVEMFESKIGRLKGFEVWHPMLGKEALRNEMRFRAEGYQHVAVATNHAIFERDQWMVRNCDIVLADLSEATMVSIGTMYELAWASLLGKHTVVVLPEDGVHQHAFVRESADIVFPTVEEALSYLEGLPGR